MVSKVEFRFAPRRHRRLAVLGRDVPFAGDGPVQRNITSLAGFGVGVGSIYEISTGGEFLVDETVEETV